VLVRVVVRDNHGNVVSRLSQSDFQLFDNGKQQEIAYFSAENAATRPAAAETIATEKSGAPPAPESDRHYTALFFDDYHLQRGDYIRTRKAAQGFLRKALNAGDWVGIFTASGSVGIDFTTDADKLQKALSQLRYQASPTPGSGTFSQDTLKALQNLVWHMGKFPGGRKIGLISDGFENQAHQDLLNQLIDVAIRGDVTINALDAYGLVGETPYGNPSNRNIDDLPGSQKERFLKDTDADVMRQAAEGTGGVFVYNSNDYDGGLERIGGEAEASYVLGFTPDDLKFDRRFHRLKTIVTAHSN
jgi:VWFA-related protein